MTTKDNLTEKITHHKMQTNHKTEVGYQFPLSTPSTSTSQKKLPKKLTNKKNSI
jgi:hypothetical protein